MTSAKHTSAVDHLLDQPVIQAIAAAGGAAYLDEIPHSTQDLRILKAAAELDLLSQTAPSFFQLPGTDRRTVNARRFRGHVTCVSAARLYGYPTREFPVRTHLALQHNHGIRSTRSRPTAPVRIHRENRITPAMVEGIPTVAPSEAVARTLMCPDVEDIDALAVLDSALNQRHVTIPDLEDLLQGQRASRARRLITQADPHARSILETMARTYLVQAGFRIRTGVIIDGVGELDILVEELLDLETDGFTFHSTPEQMRHDHERDQRLIARGIIPLRLAYEHVMSGREYVVSAVRGALASFQRMGLAPCTSSGPPAQP